MADVNGKIKWPFGPADVQSFAPAAAVTLTISNQLTYANASAAMAADMAISFVKDGQIQPGARVIVKAASDGTARAITTSTGGQGTSEGGVINKTKVLTYEFNGTAFVLMSARQID